MAAQKIPPQRHLELAFDLAMGEMGTKALADKYGVSWDYIVKVKRGERIKRVARMAAELEEELFKEARTLSRRAGRNAVTQLIALMQDVRPVLGPDGEPLRDQQNNPIVTHRNPATARQAAMDLLSLADPDKSMVRVGVEGPRDLLETVREAFEWSRQIEQAGEDTQGEPEPAADAQAGAAGLAADA